MAYEQKNGQITVWKNEQYEKGGNKPYAKGKGKDHNGNEVEITLWIPKSDKIKGFNLTIGEPYKAAQQVNTTVAEVLPPPPAEGEDDLPF
jgi:hypothetical protein